MTLKVAHFAPGRVRRVVPMGAEGIAPISLKFLWRMFPMLAFPCRKTITGLLRFLTPSNLPINEHLVEERLVVYRNFRQAKTRPPLFTDEELSQISAPTLLLYGEHEVVYDLPTIRKRVASLPLNFHPEVIPNAGHVLDYDQPTAVSARIAKFIKAET